MKRLFFLAIPMVIMQLGLMLFGLVDIYFVGKFSAAALAGVGLAHATIFGGICFGIGSMLGIDTLASQAFGAGQKTESIRVVQHAFLLALPIGLVLAMLLFLAESFYIFLGVDPEIMVIASEFIKIGKWIVFPAICFTAIRQGLQAVQWGAPLVWIVGLTNLLNIIINYFIVWGRGGFPALGATGSAYATLISNSLMLFLGIFSFSLLCKRWNLSIVPAKIDFQLIKNLWQLGWPAGTQFFLEVGVFSLSTAMMAKFGPAAAAAHQTTIALASTAFMVPMGISYATAVKVGEGIGAKDFSASKRAGYQGLALGVAFMACSCITLSLFPDYFLTIFTKDRAVIEYATGLLFFVVIFQIFDGVQVVSGGALRGRGETAISMWANLIGHWGIGFPLGLWLAFKKELGGRGLWAGLCVGLICVAIILFYRWWSINRKITGI